MRSFLVILPVLAAALSLPLAGQAAKAPAKGAAPAKAAPPATPPQPTDSVSQEAIDDVVAAKRIPYRPKTDRDPFATTSEAKTVHVLDSIDEISVLGRVQSGGKIQGIILDSRGKTKFIQAGFQFRDGRLVSIEPTALVFVQWDPQSSNRNVTKQVVKPFKREEGR